MVRLGCSNNYDNFGLCFSASFKATCSGCPTVIMIPIAVCVSIHSRRLKLFACNVFVSFFLWFFSNDRRIFNVENNCPTFHMKDISKSVIFSLCRGYILILPHTRITHFNLFRFVSLGMFGRVGTQISCKYRSGWIPLSVLQVMFCRIVFLLMRSQLFTLISLGKPYFLRRISSRQSSIVCAKNCKIRTGLALDLDCLWYAYFWSLFLCPVVENFLFPVCLIHLYFNVSDSWIGCCHSETSVCFTA